MITTRREFLKGLGALGAVAATPILSFGQEPDWNEAQRRFSEKYLFIPTYDSEVMYRRVPGEKLLQPSREIYNAGYRICKQVTQDGTFQQIVAALNPEFLKDLKKVEDSRPDYNSEVFANQMVQVSTRVAPAIFAKENQKIRYLDPNGQPNEYIDRGIINITEQLYSTWNRMRIDQKSQMHPINIKEAETSEYNTKYGDIRMMIKRIEEYANGRPFSIMVRPVHDFESPRNPGVTYRFMIMMQGPDGRFRIVNERIPRYATDLKGQFIPIDPSKGDEECNRKEIPNYQQAVFNDSNTISKIIALAVETVTKRGSHLVFVPYEQFVIQSPGHPDLKVVTGFRDGKWFWDRPKPQDIERFRAIVRPAVLSLRTPPRGETTVEMQRERQFELAGGRKSSPDKPVEVKDKDKGTSDDGQKQE